MLQSAKTDYVTGSAVRPDLPKPRMMQHQTYDCAIKLLLGAAPPKGWLYFHEQVHPSGPIGGDNSSLLFSCWYWVLLCRKERQDSLAMYRLLWPERNHSKQSVSSPSHLLSLWTIPGATHLYQIRPSQHLSHGLHLRGTGMEDCVLTLCQGTIWSCHSAIVFQAVIMDILSEPVPFSVFRWHTNLFQVRRGACGSCCQVLQKLLQHQLHEGWGDRKQFQCFLTSLISTADLSGTIVRLPLHYTISPPPTPSSPGHRWPSHCFASFSTGFPPPWSCIFPNPSFSSLYS